MNPKRSRRAALNRSDCEDNSSDEEEFTQVISSKITWYLLDISYTFYGEKRVPVKLYVVQA